MPSLTYVAFRVEYSRSQITVEEPKIQAGAFLDDYYSVQGRGFLNRSLCFAIWQACIDALEVASQNVVLTSAKVSCQSSYERSQ